MDKIVWKIARYEELSSSNDLLYEKVHKDPLVIEGHGIQTEYQTKGKGQIGNSWESEKGENLLISILLKPGIYVDQQFVISQLVSIAIVEALTDLELNDVRIKWPNDIYVGDRKIGGILIQNLLKGRFVRDCIVGIGLNINQLDFPSDLPNPTSIAKELACFQEIPSIEKNILSKINRYYQEFFAHPRNQINHLYHFLLYRRNVLSSFKSGDRIFEGSIDSVARDGTLMIRTNKGIESFVFREIKFII